MTPVLLVVLFEKLMGFRRSVTVRLWSIKKTGVFTVLLIVGVDYLEENKYTKYVSM